MTDKRFSLTDVAQALRECLAGGDAVEIYGLGTFRPAPGGGIDFIGEQRPRVFLAYVEEDFRMAEQLYEALEKAGIKVWLDKMELLPGQNWPRAIEHAIGVSDFFVPCFSRRAACKRGTFHAELRYALDCAIKHPLDEVFVMPVRLDDCEVPSRIRESLQYVDLFPDWEKGVRRLLVSIDRQMKLRGRKRLPLAS